MDDLSALMLPVKLRTALNGVWVVAVWGYEDSRVGHRTRVVYWDEAPPDPTELL